MAKKVRKPRSQNPRTYAQIRTPDDERAWTPPSSGADQSLAGAKSKSSLSAAPKSTAVDWERQYGYVFKDLRRTFILAAGLLLLLIALNIVLQLL